MKIIIVFAIISMINVIFSVIRELLTINSDKTIAAIINAGYFSFYNVMIIYTVSDFPLWIKCVITFFSNLIGVYAVKYFEEKNKPVKLWKVEVAFHFHDCLTQFNFKDLFIEKGIECAFFEVGNWTMYHCYCDTKEQVKFLKEFCKNHNGRISAYESASL